MPFASPDQLHTTFADALAAGDVDALVDLYETGAIQLQQDGHVLTGRDNLRPVFVALLKAKPDMQGSQRHALVAEDIALTSTSYEIRTQDPDGHPVTVKVVSAEVSRRQPDGTWRVLIDAPRLRLRHPTQPSTPHRPPRSRPVVAIIDVPPPPPHPCSTSVTAATPASGSRCPTCRLSVRGLLEHMDAHDVAMTLLSLPDAANRVTALQYSPGARPPAHHPRRCADAAGTGRDLRGHRLVGLRGGGRGRHAVQPRRRRHLLRGAAGHRAAGRPVTDDPAGLARPVADGHLQTAIGAESSWRDVGELVQGVLSRQFTGKAVLHLTEDPR